MQIVTYDKTCKVDVTEPTRRNWKINSGSRNKIFLYIWFISEYFHWNVNSIR